MASEQTAILSARSADALRHRQDLRELVCSFGVVGWLVWQAIDAKLPHEPPTQTIKIDIASVAIEMSPATLTVRIAGLSLADYQGSIVSRFLE